MVDIRIGERARPTRKPVIGRQWPDELSQRLVSMSQLVKSVGDNSSVKLLFDLLEQLQICFGGRGP